MMHSSSPDTARSSALVAPNDAVVAHAVELLQRTDDAVFVRWADICDDLFVQDSHGNTLLHWAAALGQLKPLKFLVHCGLDLEARNETGATPLLCAAASCRNPGSVISYFMRAGARMDAENKAGDTVLSLLDKRDLGTLVDIFGLLKDSMESCPRLFSSSGHDATDGAALAANAHCLGTVQSVARQVSTVRFRSDGPHKLSSPSPLTTVSALHATEGESVDDSELGAVDRSSSPWGFTLGGLTHDFTTASSPGDAWRDTLLAEEALLRGGIERQHMEGLVPVLADLLQFTTWLYNTLVLEVYTDDDEDDSGEEKEEEADSVADKETECADEDPVAGVFGERHDVDGERVLLIQWNHPERRGDSGAVASVAPAPEEEELEWVPFRSIADSHCVQRYVEQFDRTYSDTALHGDDDSSFGLDRTNSHGGALDDEERDEFERILGMIPRRQLSPEATGTWRLSERMDSSSGEQRVHDGAAGGGLFSPDTPDMYGHTNHDELPAMRRTVQGEGNEAVLSDEEDEVATTCAIVQRTAAHVPSTRSSSCSEEQTGHGGGPTPIVHAQEEDGAFTNPRRSPFRAVAEAAPQEFPPAPPPTHANGQSSTRMDASPLAADSSTALSFEAAARDVSEKVPQLSHRFVPATAAKRLNPMQQQEAAPAPPPPTRQCLSSAEQVSYQRFLYQSAMERIRARNTLGVAIPLAK